MEEQRIIDKKEMTQLISDNKKEIIDKISAFEANTTLELTSISNTLAYERTRVDVIYDERKEVTVNWSAKIMAMNSAFAGIIAFVVSMYK